MSDYERPVASLDARLQELFLMHIAADPLWADTAHALADDLATSDEVVDMLSAVCRFVTNLAIGYHGGQDVAVARFTADLLQLRAVALREASEQ